LFLLPSETESFGLAALEAMACQVPIITSNAGGIPEVNIQGVTGFMSEIGDIDDMVKNSLFVLKDENLPTFKANALEKAKEFDIKNVVPQYEAYYQKIIDKVASKELYH
jgi:L-malate glycosyltransferase